MGATLLGVRGGRGNTSWVDEASPYNTGKNIRRRGDSGGNTSTAVEGTFFDLLRGKEDGKKTPSERSAKKRESENSCVVASKSG